MKKIAAFFIALVTLIVVSACVPDTTPPPDLVFDPAELPDAQVGVGYKTMITISQNVTPVFQIYLSDGALPDGLTLENQQFDQFVTVTGTPTTAGTFKFSVTVICFSTSVDGQTAQREYSIEVK